MRLRPSHASGLARGAGSTQQTPASGLARALRWLGRPHAALWLGGLALLLVSPALGGGFALDDYVLRLLARDDPGFAGFHANPLLLFSFTSGRPADNHALMDAGALLPWWSDPHHLNAFFRPLSSLAHLLDFRLWPHSPLLMHLHSLLWFAALLGVVAHVYRQLGVGPAALGDRGRVTRPSGEARFAPLPVLAFALFALDGAHGMTVAWIANRNALVAATLALPALAAHHRWLAQGFRPGAYLGPLCFALGLCGGETALAVLGYLLAYTVVLDRAPWGRRLLHLLPYLVLLALWRATFLWLGLGSAGSGAYHDPGREPLAYAAALLQHLPVLLSAQLALPLADAWFWGAPELHLPIWLLSLASLALLAAAGHVLLRHDEQARFWGLGMVLSACAVAASVPGERLLLVPGVGGAAFVAMLVWKLLPAASTDASGRAERVTPQPRWAPPLLAALLLLHGVVAPLSLPAQASALRLLSAAIARVDRDIPRAPSIAARTVIVVNAPFDVMLSYLQVAREAEGVPRPQHLYWLATASSPLSLQRVDARTLRIRAARGFLLTEPERHYRGDPRGLPVGSEVALSQMRVKILAVTPDGRPAAAEFRFREPLGSPRYLLRRYSHGRLLPLPPLAAGQSLSLPREDFLATLLAQAFGPAPGP